MFLSQSAALVVDKAAESSSASYTVTKRLSIIFGYLTLCKSD